MPILKLRNIHHSGGIYNLSNSNGHINSKTVIKLIDELKFFFMEKMKDQGELTKKEFDIINNKISEMKNDINGIGSKISLIPDYKKDFKLSLIDNVASIILKIGIGVLSAWAIYFFFTKYIK